MRLSVFFQVTAIFCTLCLFAGHSSSTDKRKLATTYKVDIDEDEGKKTCKATLDIVVVKHNDKVYWHSNSATPDYRIDFKHGSPFSDSNVHSDNAPHMVTATCTNSSGCPYTYSITRQGEANACEDPTVQIIPDRHNNPPPK
jgi:hypothetical protein